MSRIIKFLKNNYGFFIIVGYLIYVITTQTKNEPLVVKKLTDCELLPNYLEKENILNRKGYGLPIIDLDNYYKDSINNDIIFIKKGHINTGLFKVSLDCKLNIFLDSYLLENGDVIRIQSSFSNNYKFENRYVLIYRKSGATNFIEDLEFIKILKENPYILNNKTSFYGLNFESDTIIDVINKKRIVCDSNYNCKYLNSDYPKISTPEDFLNDFDNNGSD
jgi:hypothetical protein